MLTQRLQPLISLGESAEFSLDNLPYGVFTSSGHPQPEVGVALGDRVVSLTRLEALNLLKLSRPVFGEGKLNSFMSLGQDSWRKLRQFLQIELSQNSKLFNADATLLDRVLLKRSDIKMKLPFDIAGYTDFYSSKEHATNMGTMFRGKDAALFPNWSHMPIGYDGRASSIVVSGTDIVRPKGQSKGDADPAPKFGPSRALCCELELGTVIGSGSRMFEPIPIAQASEHVFGFVLLNDWSARDIQKWEYVPLGPFLGKNFATSISPWVVTLEALRPFLCEGPIQDPSPLEYLKSNSPYNLDINLEILLKTPTMGRPEAISKTNSRLLYWNFCQQIAHHTSNGCNLACGDLLGTGTISGSEPGTYGSMIELSWAGKTPIQLSSGETRIFLEDGDTLYMRGVAQKDNLRIGFGEVTGTVLPAL